MSTPPSPFSEATLRNVASFFFNAYQTRKQDLFHQTPRWGQISEEEKQHIMEAMREALTQLVVVVPPVDRSYDRIIYLDVDGVLCLQSETKFTCSAVKTRLKLLAYVVYVTGAQLVLASDWRLHAPEPARRKLLRQQLRDSLSAEGLYLTGHTRLSIPDKCEAIRDHMNAHKGPAKFVILDDMGPETFGPDLAPYLIQCYHKVGLDASVADKIIYRFNYQA